MSWINAGQANCRPDRNDREVLLSRLMSAPHRARVHQSGRINTPEVPAPSILFAQPGHPSNRARDSFFGHPEQILLVFQVADEHAGFDADEWFSVQSSHDGRDVQIVQVSKFPRPEFVVAVLSGAVMSRT